MAKTSPVPVHGDFEEAAAAEVSTAEEVEALALTVDTNNSADWTYSATAEDRGTAGELDGEPGMIYNGPSGVGVVVTYTNLDIAEGTIAPEATDGFSTAVYKNSALAAHSDEGFVVELDTETADEQNLANGTYLTLDEGDVVRIAVVGDSEVETSDVDIAEGGEWQIA